MAAQTLGAIIDQVKSVCTKRIRAAGAGDCAWQCRFTERFIHAHIRDNPAKWAEDRH
jgi:hypothetical protein